MKKLIILIALFCTQVLAELATPEQVANECIAQMQMGVCRARPDRAMITPGQTMLISGVGRVSYSAYLDYMDLHDEKNTSDPAMCKLALSYMISNPGGDHDKVARALWSPQLHSAVKRDMTIWPELGIKITLIFVSTLLTFKLLNPKIKLA